MVGPPRGKSRSRAIKTAAALREQLTPLPELGATLAEVCRQQFFDTNRLATTRPSSSWRPISSGPHHQEDQGGLLPPFGGPHAPNVPGAPHLTPDQPSISRGGSHPRTSGDIGRHNVLGAPLGTPDRPPVSRGGGPLRASGDLGPPGAPLGAPDRPSVSRGLPWQVPEEHRSIDRPQTSVSSSACTDRPVASRGGLNSRQRPWRATPEESARPRTTDTRVYGDMDGLLDPTWEDSSDLLLRQHLAEQAASPHLSYNRSWATSSMSSWRSSRMKASQRSHWHRAATARSSRSTTAFEMHSRISPAWKSTLILTSKSKVGQEVILADPVKDAVSLEKAAKLYGQEVRARRLKAQRGSRELKPGVYSGHQQPIAPRPPEFPPPLPSLKSRRANLRHVEETELLSAAVNDGGGEGWSYQAEGEEELEGVAREPAKAGKQRIYVRPNMRAVKTTWARFRDGKPIVMAHNFEDASHYKNRENYETWKKQVVACARNLQLEVNRFRNTEL